MNAPLRHPLVRLKERPFDGLVRVLPVVWSAAPTIAEILDAQADVPPRFRALCVARINGELVPREMWRYVRPKRELAIDVIVTFTMPVHGGGGGGGGGAAMFTVVLQVAECPLSSVTVPVICTGPEDAPVDE